MNHTDEKSLKELETEIAHLNRLNSRKSHLSVAGSRNNGAVGSLSQNSVDKKAQKRGSRLTVQFSLQ